MEKYFLGIDIGTSAVKVLARGEAGDIVKGRCAYSENTPKAHRNALKCALHALSDSLSLSKIAGIGLSSQVGTYVTDTGYVISWNQSHGREELSAIKAEIPDDVFVREIGMSHPDLVSYPLPRLKYIKAHYPDSKSVLMPKELILRALTGQTVSDPFSWRGLADIESGKYSQKLLDMLKIDLELPILASPTTVGGYISADAAKEYGLAAGTPVYVGCNDFFAGLLGSGVYREGDIFDLSGTSEHIGVISAERASSAFVSGRYFNGFASYGGTKASGASCAFAIDNFTLDGVGISELANSPPIFLPYLTGERAPIFDENARGVFFGINDKTNRRAMAYSILEGVAFSLYDIGQSLGIEDGARILSSGGSSQDPLLACLKAELFGCDVYACRESDASALGAAMIAMVGQGVYRDYAEAIDACVKSYRVASYSGKYRDKLLRRFEIYRSVYKNLKTDFSEFAKI